MYINVDDIFFKLLIDRISSADKVVQIIGSSKINESVEKEIKKRLCSQNVFFFTTIDESWDTVWVRDGVVLDAIAIVNNNKIVDFIEKDQIKKFHDFAHNNFHRFKTGLDVYNAYK